MSDKNTKKKPRRTDFFDALNAIEKEGQDMRPEIKGGAPEDRSYIAGDLHETKPREPN